MRTFKGAKVAVLTAGLAVWAMLTYACTADDENPAPPNRAGADSGGEGSVTPPGVTPPGTSGVLCASHGGYDAMKTLADKIIDRAAADCRISPAFAGANIQHFKECFEQQFAGSSQVACAGVSYIANTTKDSKGEKCREMTQAHQGLPGNHKIRLADFNAFVEAASAEFAAAGITDKSELTSLASFFEGTKAGVVLDLTQPNANSFCTDTVTCAACKPADAGIIDTGIIDTGTDTGTITDAATDG